MDVQAKNTKIKPHAAKDRPRRVRGDLSAAGLIVLAALLVAVVTGTLSWGGFFLAGGIAASGLVLRAVIPRPATLWGGLTEEAAEEVERLRRASKLLDSLPQPVMLLDEKDRVEVANASAVRVFGKGALGQHIAGVVRAPQALGALREARHDMAAKEAEFSTAGPEPLSALFYVAPLSREAIERDGEMIVMVRDRTEQRMLERMRTDFIANASHELRTPLASILGFIETLQGHAKNDPEARARFLRIMQAQTERMLRLVKDLVSLSALELNERRLPQDEVDLCEVSQMVHDMMVPVAKGEDGTLALAPCNCEAAIAGERDQMIQVAQNLIDNALKYGRPSDEDGAEVTLSVGRGPGSAFQGADRSGDSPEQIAVRAGCAAKDLVYLRVEDRGNGIERTDLPRVTERFYRIDVERSHKKGGTGLGLAIVKHIVGRHRGGILVESAEGRGTAFTCYFPPRQALQDEQRAGL
ncbi:ATP-binding protein [Parvularcula maris]|uniref:histidine kinase n=1 Tax=Parvularcula maris TaxID=2965077 RepID=A0A9X2L9Z8_9PROT|nr:ATP-binding protein [Parvularcula maris]MCQ8185839.1 ATP-binding protein [Parvularcula maris]